MISNSHPLINQESTHYGSDYEGSTIEYLEKKRTLKELRSWAIINIEKYEQRLGKKIPLQNILPDYLIENAKEETEKSDIKKIETYKNYIKFLDALEYIVKMVFKRKTDIDRMLEQAPLLDIYESDEVIEAAIKIGSVFNNVGKQ